MRIFHTLIFVFALASCQDGVLPRDTPNNEEELDQGCTMQYIQAQISGDEDLNLYATTNAISSLISYSSPTGIHIQGKQAGAAISVNIKYYEGPGEYKISLSNVVVFEVVDQNEKFAYVSNSGSIVIQEFLSPTNGVCVKAVFSIDAADTKSARTISIVNGEFEAVVS